MNSSLSSKCSEALWDINGFISIEFDLYEGDITCMNRPDPIIVLASRYSYLPIIAEEVISYYQQSVLEFSSDIWFESNNIPLKSNLPIGVLHDLYGTSTIVESLNWKIIIRFKDFPNQLLLKCHSLSSIENYYFHSLKQALFTLYGSTNGFNQLSVENQKKLWQSIKLIDYNLFEQIIGNAELRPNVLTEATLRISLPIRVLCKGKATLQRPVFIENRNKTLYDVIYNDFNYNNNNNNNNRPSIIGDNRGDTHSTTTDMYVKIHGITIPWDSPIYELWMLMSYCDLYLYITLVIAG